MEKQTPERSKKGEAGWGGGEEGFRPKGVSVVASGEVVTVDRPNPKIDTDAGKESQHEPQEHPSPQHHRIEPSTKSK